MERSHAEIPAKERAEIFHETYGNDLDAGDTLADFVLAAGKYISDIVGPEDTDLGMARIVAGVCGGPLSEPLTWREALSNARSNCFSEWKAGPRLHSLAAYALYGIVLSDQENADPAREIEALIDHACALQRATPFVQWNLPPNNDLERLVLLATNRWALDNGQPVEPAALAVFGGVSEGRIRNMMSGPKRSFSPESGRIPAHEALAWLAGRETFWNSVWRDQPMPTYGIKRERPLDQPVFVPVARDGTPFHPGLLRGSGFTIGEKGNEFQVDTFEAALAHLHRMPTPYWRRPNNVGNWGIVAGIRWERLTPADLEAVAASPEHRLPDNLRA